MLPNVNDIKYKPLLSLLLDRITFLSKRSNLSFLCWNAKIPWLKLSLISGFALSFINMTLQMVCYTESSGKPLLETVKKKAFKKYLAGDWRNITDQQSGANW